MKKNISFIFAILLVQLSSSFAQMVYPSLMTSLPDTLKETSGIEINHANNIWTHNDSGDKARIFNIDTLGNILRTLYLKIDTAIDCEEATQDVQGNYYIGDFGNNYNDRTNLRIYKIPNPDSIFSDSVVPQIIQFNFPDQTLFPPDSTQRNFDCEAMFHFNDSLYLFSKNRGISTFTKLYRLPDQPGNYTALLVDSFNTGNWVTSADISPSGKTMALLSETRIWLFTGYTNTDFFGGLSQYVYMSFSQKESIVFVNDTLVYITDEKFLGVGGNLYSLNLASYINSVDEIKQLNNAIKIYPNPAHNELNISLNEDMRPYEIEIYNVLGELKIKSTNTLPIDVVDLPPGIYIVNVEMKGKQFQSKFIKE